METLQQIAAILLVLGLLASALYLLRKKKLAGFTGSGRLQVLERVSLTPQHTVCLVRVDDRVLLIATSPGSCQITEKCS